jgi:N-formylglutamate amidohydrolase
MASAAWQIEEGGGPLVAAAIHAGHRLDPEVARHMALDEASRLREEDPHTDGWLDIAPNRIRVLRSRFEFDLNRPANSAVYLEPEQAWGLRVWRSPPPAALIERSRALHRAFYAEVEAFIARRLERCPRLVLLDLHSYNHRRAGPAAAPADAAHNPEINLGTASVADPGWRPLIDAFADALRGAAAPALDVRENVKFQGGAFVRWCHARFGARVCALAIEVKKTFMDEWNAQLDRAQHDRIGRALAAAAAAIERRLEPCR